MRDIVLDVLAAVLLLSALALPWDFSSSDLQTWNAVHDRWWVVVSLVIALVGLGLPYLAASRAVPGLTPQVTLLAKLGTVAPLAISIAFVVLFECIHVASDEKGGIGAGATLLLLAGLLVLVPRSHDDLPGLHAPARGAERILYAATAGVVVISVLVAVIRLLLADGDGLFGHTDAWEKVCGVLLLIVFVLPVVVPAAGAAARIGSAWPPIAAAALAAYVFVAFFRDSVGQGLVGGDLPAFGSFGGEKLGFSGDASLVLTLVGLGAVGVGVLLLAAAVGLLSGPWQGLGQDAGQRARWWVRVAATAAFFAAALLAVQLVYNTLVYALTKANDAESHVNGTWIACMVLLAIGCVVAAATGLLAARLDQQRLLPVVLAAVWLLLGFVTAVVTSTADSLGLLRASLLPMFMPETFAMIFAPLLVLGSLTLPRCVRATFGSVVTVAQINAVGQGQPPAQQFPGQQPPPPYAGHQPRP